MDPIIEVVKESERGEKEKEEKLEIEDKEVVIEVESCESSGKKRKRAEKASF